MSFLRQQIAVGMKELQSQYSCNYKLQSGNSDYVARNMRSGSASKSYMALKLVSVYCFALLIFFASPITQAKDRFALIIGNNLYQHASH
jgi:hypothetical protein